MGLVIKRYSYINDRRASVDGRAIPVPAGEDKFLTALYRARRVDYPKFFKMDNLSRLGFLAAELIFGEDEPRFIPREDVAILCFNRSSSLESDAGYQATIREEEYFPSPSLFVYTLPNIVTAEIAIRNKLHGETAFYVQERFDARPLVARVGEAFQDAATRAVLVAWVESFRDSREVFMMLVEKNDTIFGLPFSEECIVELLNRGRNG